MGHFFNFLRHCLRYSYPIFSWPLSNFLFYEDGEDIQHSAIEVETVSPCIISSTVAEPLSYQSVSLVAQEVIPRIITIMYMYI